MKHIDNSRQWRPLNRPQGIKVGKYFLLSDFLYSETLVTKGGINPPPPQNSDAFKAICKLCEKILDPIVDRFGPVSITYGYISPELARLMKSSSLHRYAPRSGLIGGAADVRVHSPEHDPRDVLRWVRDHCEYDRLILYPGSQIICVAWTSKPRYDCKEWIYLQGSASPHYIDLRDNAAIENIAAFAKNRGGELSQLSLDF